MLYTILLIFVPMLLGIWAQMRISSTYNHWKNIASRGRITGAEAAAALMRSAGIRDVEITLIPGHLTDHYDPRNRRLALSEENYRGTSLAALGVAAHEAGHAIQHKERYAPLELRMRVVPLTHFASQLLPFVMFGGFFLMHSLLPVYLGIIAYLILTVFQLITLPVEFDASRRAREHLLHLGIIEHDEQHGVVQTLNAAAWTYVAAFVTSLGWLLYFLLQANNRR